jgi:hypothetical protein
MKKKIAVESQLSNVSDYLTNQGYDVLEFQHNQELPEKFKNAAAIVTTGLDENLLGMHNIATDAVVIEASGLSPEKIGEMLNERLG